MVWLSVDELETGLTLLWMNSMITSRDAEAFQSKERERRLWTWRRRLFDEFLSKETARLKLKEQIELVNSVQVTDPNKLKNVISNFENLLELDISKTGMSVGRHIRFIQAILTSVVHKRHNLRE